MTRLQRISDVPVELAAAGDRESVPSATVLPAKNGASVRRVRRAEPEELT